VPPAASVMLKQEDLALLRAVSSVQGNPVLLRELRKDLAPKKTAKAAASCTAKTFCVTPSERHATTTGARIVPPPLPITGKRRAEFSCLDGLSTPAARRPAPDTPNTSGAPTPAGSKETVGKAAYAAVLAGDTNLVSRVGTPNT
jgi:hypothetical protein